ncbi:hypothetical protein E7Z59_14180 [Robertkochia marina]|uniref:NIPSNAP domain-containing protein n=1 Tax=Robertkochia marina TaxID=1227945 RepID=A0A4S3LXD9_9FLAO|nr:hypothetical protein [Robertkochia marina]THD65732.1 hypothetical protein E7Z59_14180 [Robertkochia marina]TRZ46584.1 hypothetical protein D3A96_03170 [Robertkochia marina]
MKIFVSILTCFLFTISGLYAQEEMKAEKYENPQWYWIVKIDFAPGKMNRAKEIIEDYFMKASEDAATPMPKMALDMTSGEYDMLVVWHMKDGIEGMNWKTSPDDVKWFQSMTKIAGSPEKAQEILNEYESYIIGSEADLGRMAW